MARMTGRKKRKMMNKGKKEIERRFLIKFLPDHIKAGIENHRYLTSHILQGYSPGKSGKRLRMEIILLGKNEKPANPDGYSFSYKDELGFLEFFIPEIKKIRFKITTKKGHGVLRLEKEDSVRRLLFVRRFEDVEFHLDKDRHHIPYGKNVIELNLFRRINDLPTDYRQVEVEFKSLRGSKKFMPPDWFGPEVTDDPKHGNYYIARNGAPKEDE
jgi:adenylate cyclase